MKYIVLFNSKKGIISKQDIYNSLIKIGADKCKYLFIHSEINFGIPNPQLSKKELLGHILDVFRELNVENILVPTFTFSFCNKEDFDVQKSKSLMGVFSEYFRLQPDALRSNDPMMSVALIGKDKSIIENIGNISCGKGCVYDLLHAQGDTKFLFLGNRMSDCMTYTHYIEVIKQVPYRYPKQFTGNIIEGNILKKKDVVLHVRYNHIEPFKDRRIDDLILKNKEGDVVYLGNTQICIANEKGVYHYLCDAIDKEPDFMLEYSCPKPPFDDYYVYEKKVAL